MIFKTFNSNIDKISSKWGMFGHSFNDIGSAIVGRMTDINKAFQATDDLVGSIKDSDSIWKRLYPSKESIETQLIDVDNLIPEINKDNFNFDLWINRLNAVDKKVKAGTISWQDFSSSLANNQKWIAKWGQETEGQIRTQNDLVKANQQARASAIAHNEAIKAQTFSAKAGKVAISALSIAMNVLANIGLTILISKIADVFTANERLLSSAKELGETFSQEQSSIEDYKNQIKDLQNTINDSSSSFDDVSQARKDLMVIQDDLIKKFGTEKETIEIITDAINNQSNALDLLTQKKYQQWKNNFNNKDFGESAKDFIFSDNFANAFYKLTEFDFSGAWSELTRPTQSNIDKMVSDMQYAYYTLQKTGNDALDSLIAKTYNLGGDGTNFVLRGNLNNVYETLLEIQELANDFSVSDSFKTSATQLANSMDKTLKSYKESYDIYVLYEKILNSSKDNPYDEQFNLINEAKEKFDEASLLGDADKINEAADEYSQTLQSAIDLAIDNWDQDVADYFKSMYPELQQMFGEWQFNLNFESNIDGLRDSINNALDAIDGVSEGNALFSAEDIENFNFNTATQEQMDAYGNLTSMAELYGLTLKQLLALLQTMGLVQSESYQQLVDTFGQENVDKLLPDELKIAYSLDNIGDMTFDELRANIQQMKETVDEPVMFSDIFSLESADGTLTNLGQLSESIATIQNAYKTLNDAIDEYNENGSFSVDTLQSVIALGDNWLDYLVDEDGALKLDKESLEQLTQARLNDMRIQAINNVIDNISKIEDDATANEYLKTTNYALADSYEEVAQKALESARAQMQAAVTAGTLSQANMDAAMNKATADISKINQLFANTSTSGNSTTASSGKSSSGSSSTFSETFDFFDRRVKTLDDAVTLLNTNLENVTGSFAKNKLLDQTSDILEERMRNYSDAVRIYQQKAQETLSGLDAETQHKIINGSVSLDNYIGENNKAVVEAMNDYQKWADKVTLCTEELASLKEELRQLELDKFNHIIQDFTDQFDLRSTAKNLIDKQISLFEEAGQLIGKAFYEEQIGQSQKQLSLLENEKTQLINQLNTALLSGRIQKGTDEWLEMVNALSDVDGSILDCKKSIETFDNAILNLHWETFDRVQDTFKDLSDEISSLIGVMDQSDVATKDNQWTKEGLTQLGLYSQQYELATYQVSQYADAIDKLNADYLNGKYSATEYADKLADLRSAQWDAVNAAESAKDSILELNEARIHIVTDGIQEEINAYKELIDSQIKALDAEKDLHEYQNSIAQKNKSITALERQLAAMQNDNTAATVAKRKQLEQQLAESRADLEETQYEHSVETQKEMLNQQYADYEDARNREIETLEMTLENRESLIASSMETVKENTQVIADEITDIANQHGVNVSYALTSSWASGENAIASYGEALSQRTSAFIGNIMAVESQVYQLQADADITAVSLANMFGTSADNLVNELSNSYFAELNLLHMTDALHSSLINTLQSGYDVSNVVNSLNAISDAADRTRAALAGINGVNNFDTPSAAKTKGKVTVPKKNQYASGKSRITADQLAITNEAGQELIYHAADGSILTRLLPGDKVFDNVSAERLWQLSQGIIPSGIMANIKLPNVDNIRKTENAVNVHYDSMITVNGDVNDTNHFTKQVQTVAKEAIADAVKTAEKTRKYGMF